MTDELNDLINGLEVSLAAVFLAAIFVWRSGIDYLALVTALRNRDIESALYALHLDRGVFSQYVIERQSGFAKVGEVESKQLGASRIAFFKKRGPEPTPTRILPGLPGSPTARAPDYETPRAPAPTRPVDAPATPAAPAPVVPPTQAPPAPPTLAAPGGGSVQLRFDMTNPRAEDKIRTEAAARVSGYVDEQVETARRVIADGFARGEGPQTIATDIAGRINPISGKREGGIIGLSDPQVDYVENMRRRLLSSDPDEMAKVLGRFDKDGKWVEGTGQTLRDRRYDAAIKKAIRDVAVGKPNPLTGDKIDEMTAKYSDRLLKRRAEDIARTETAQGVMAARAEATQQAMDRDNLADEALTKTWRHNGGIEHARDWHLAVNGQSVVGARAVFYLPDGSTMLHSHDPQGGVRNNVSCRCSTDFEIDWAHGL